MLTQKARHEIFGLVLETTFESGDFIDFLHSTQKDNDDWTITLLTFKRRWAQVKKILIDVGAWVNRWEAIELTKLLMKHHQITNDNIWEETFHTDPDLHLWEQQEKDNKIFDRRSEAIGNEKDEIDRVSLIRAIINLYMIDTRILQDTDQLPRLDYTFSHEIQMVIDKIIYYRLPVTLEELCSFVRLEFPRLPQSCIHYLEQNYQEIFKIHLPEKLKPKISIPDEDFFENFDQMFDAIHEDEIPEFETREPTSVPNGNNLRLKVKLADTSYNLTAEGIINSLKELFPDYTIDEIQTRAMDKLRSFRKHARDVDMIEVYWKLLKTVEIDFLKEWQGNNKESEYMQKLGKIRTALSLFIIEMGNDTALLMHLKKNK